LQGIQGRNRSFLLQATDNAANERIRQRLKGENFSAEEKDPGTMCNIRVIVIIYFNLMV